MTIIIHLFLISKTVLELQSIRCKSKSDIHTIMFMSASRIFAHVTRQTPVQTGK